MKFTSAASSRVAGLALCLFGLTAALPARAQWALDFTVNRVVVAVDLARERIVGAISGLSTAQTTATAESARVIADANTQTASEIKRVDAINAGEPLDPCGVTAVARGGQATSTNRPAGSGRGGGGPGGGGSPASPTAGATADMKKALDIANGAIPTPPPEIAAALAVSGACGTFAKGTLREASCTGAGFSPGVSSGYPNADIRAETIFDGPQSSADVALGTRRKLTISGGNSSERMAVNAFVRNLETPLDLRSLTAKELANETGRNYMAIRDSYDASMSLATKPLRDQEGLITATKDTLPILTQMMKGEDGPYISSTLDKAFPAWKTEGISMAQLMSLEANRRYMNAGWQVRMAAANDRQLLAEQVQLQAFNGFMAVALLEKMQQVAIIQGAAAGSAMRTEKMPQLVAAHRAAKLP